ncbi:MAG: hypothetical protein AAF170_15455 [Bacteroidota bacterium]
MSHTDPFDLRSFRLVLRASGVGFALGLVLLLLDVLAGVQLPQPFRAGVPWLLIGTSGVGITLLVGALGTPKRSSQASRESMPPDGDGSPAR